jgi:hypothetical protein
VCHFYTLPVTLFSWTYITTWVLVSEIGFMPSMVSIMFGLLPSTIFRLVSSCACWLLYTQHTNIEQYLNFLYCCLEKGRNVTRYLPFHYIFTRKLVFVLISTHKFLFPYSQNPFVVQHLGKRSSLNPSASKRCQFLWQLSIHFILTETSS